MKRYTVKQHYHSAWGDLTRGTVVELDDATVEWLLRDSPGVVEPVEALPPEPLPDPIPDKSARAMDEPAQNRQVTRAPAKRVVPGYGK
jgi:hypothetical protein